MVPKPFATVTIASDALHPVAATTTEEEFAPLVTKLRLVTP